MTITQDRRIWLGGGVLATVLLVAASWFLLINPTMSDTNSLRSQTSDAQLQNDLLRSKIAKLQRQKDAIATLQSKLASSLLSLPTDSGLPAFTREVTQQASDRGLTLQSIVVTGISQTSANGTLSTSGTATGNPAGRLFAIPVTMIVTGSVSDELSMLHDLQYDGPRAALVNSTSFTGQENAGGLALHYGSQLTVQVTLFSAPKTPAQEAQLQKDVASAIAAGPSTDA